MSFQSWLNIDLESPFSLANIPFGIISTSSNSTPRPAIAIGSYALDLSVFASIEGFSLLPIISSNLAVFSAQTLNPFAALGQLAHNQVRIYLQEVFLKDGSCRRILQDNKALQEQALLDLASVTMHVPMHIGDYTDFYAGRNHAYNVSLSSSPSSPALKWH
jgi:fumarylacetoacetase